METYMGLWWQSTTAAGRTARMAKPSCRRRQPPEPLLKIDLFANFAQFVYDDANPENPLGARATTTANNGSNQLVPNTDAFLCAWQVGAKFNFPHIFTSSSRRRSTITPATATRLTSTTRAVIPT